MKKPETALAATEKRQQVSYSDSETDRKDPAVKPEPVAVLTESKDTVEAVTETTIPRVWSDEEEIAVLQSLMDYETVTGVVFHADPEALYQWVKKSLSFEVTKLEFLCKTSEFACTYHCGKVVTFARPHHRNCALICQTFFGDLSESFPNYKLLILRKEN